METEQVIKRRNENWHTLEELLKDGNQISFYNPSTHTLTTHRGNTHTSYAHKRENNIDYYKPVMAQTK